MDKKTGAGSAELRDLGELFGPVERRIEALTATGFVQRLWDHDSSLWAESAASRAEVSRRLGWLDSPGRAIARLPVYRRLAADVRGAGMSRFLVLGMGGSSLATEVIGHVFAGHPAASTRRLGILDSTDPDEVAQAARDFPPDRSLYIVSSKSGGTAEVLAALEYFWELCAGDASRFIAISDEGTSLQALARERGFRGAFAADPEVGGRYSALTDFGMIPAVLLGLDPERFVASAASMQHACGRAVPNSRNPGVVLGAVLGEAAIRGMANLTLVADPELETLPNWIEQLVAESSGKEGKGMLPVALEPLDAPRVYGRDRLFVYLRASGRLDSAVASLRHTGFPLITLNMPEPYALAGEFFRWEVAVATACHIIGVNAFDQPDVQESKDRTQAKIELLRAHGRLDEGQWELDLSEESQLARAPRLMWAFLQQEQPASYVAINAYLPRRWDVIAELQRIRVLIRERTRLATTVGFGPRFQHSTGQFHKGGPNSGLFIQIVSEPEAELAIPRSPLTFGGLIRAQALGDYETLVGRGRRVLRVHLGGPQDITLLRRCLSEPTA